MNYKWKRHVWEASIDTIKGKEYLHLTCNGRGVPTNDVEISLEPNGDRVIWKDGCNVVRIKKCQHTGKNEPMSRIVVPPNVPILNF